MTGALEYAPCYFLFTLLLLSVVYILVFITQNDRHYETCGGYRRGGQRHLLTITD